MGSVITKLPDSFNQTGALGSKKPQLTYLQFQQGVVTDVVTSKQSKACGGVLRNINSIIAQPHIVPDGVKRKGMGGEKNRYYPLFRGMVDVPVIGDPVLLCTVGGVQYYLGPINTAGLPNFNPDHLDVNNVQASKTESKTVNEQKGISINFKRGKVQRLNKPLNKILDDPKENLASLAELHGDMVFEGRHGNSIRIGSRHINPYIVLSNGRNFSNAVETSLDGSIFSITEYGTIREHFNRDFKVKKDSDGKIEEVEPYKFTLADSEIEEPKRHIGLTYTSGLGRGLAVDGEEDPDISQTIYGYNQNQIFMNSDRITINSRKDDMFLSAFKHIHMGSGNSMTFSTSNNILMEAETELTVNSPKINLGSGVEDNTEPIVLGDQLVSWLEALIDEINAITAIPTGAGPSGPVSATPFAGTSATLKQELEQILSQQNRTT